MTPRLDQALVGRGLARSRGQASEAVKAGLVLVNDQTVSKPSTQVADADVLVLTTEDPYVSRAAHKLVGALADTGLAIPARVLDAGASTGGFTQVLLDRGAVQVYAVDVGHGQLVDQVRTDPRVVVRERLNLRDLTLHHLDGAPVDLIVGDVSFISLRLLLEPLLAVLDADGAALLLVKPQFEVGRARLDARGVVTDARDRDRAVDAVARKAAELGWLERWRGPSRTPGVQGNVEWFLLLRRESAARDPASLPAEAVGDPR